MKNELLFQNQQDPEISPRIAFLIAGFIRESLSSSEGAELDEWVIAADKNLVLFEQLTEEKNITATLKWADGLNPSSEPDKRASPALPAKKTWAGIPLKSLYYAAASVLVLVVAAALYLSKPPGKVPESGTASTAPETRIRAGGKKALLILNNGSRVALPFSRDSSFNETDQAVVSVSRHLLSYHSSANKGDTAFNTLVTPRGGEYRVILSDGSGIWLNAGSSLRYPVSFGGNTRPVALKGEAYFEIARDARKPFTVEVKGTLIEVTGTSFNIKGYEDDSTLSSTLLRGSVKIIKGKAIQVLHPGQQAVITNSGTVERLRNVDTNEVTAWRQGKFSFKDATIQSVMSQVTRWYDVEVVYVADITKHFTGEIYRNSEITDVLKMLELTRGVHFSIEGRTITVRN